MSRLKGSVEKLERRFVSISQIPTIPRSIVSVNGGTERIIYALVQGHDRTFRRNDEAEEEFLQRVKLSEQKNTQEEVEVHPNEVTE